MTTNDLRSDQIVKYALPIAFACVTAIFGGLLLLITPVYETMDDTQMNGIVKGVLFSPSPASILFFSNTLIGLALSGLYRWIPEIPWYVVYLLGLQYLSFIAVFRTLALASPRLVSLFAGFLVSAIYCEYCLTHLSFTVTSFLCVQAGVVTILRVIISCPDDPWYRNPWIYAAIAFIFAGSLIRFHVFLLVGILTAPVLIAFVCGTTTSLRVKQNCIAISSLTAVICSLTNQCDAYWINASPNWHSYVLSNNARFKTCDLLDPALIKKYPVESEKILKNADWTENDAWMVKTWFLADDVRYSPENLERVGNQWFQMSRSNPGRVCSETLKTLGRVASEHLSVASCLFIVVLLTRSSSISDLILRSTPCITAVSVFVLLAWFQKLPERLSIPTSIYVALLVCGIAQVGNSITARQKSWGRSAVVAVLMIVAVFQCLKSIVRDSQIRSVVCRGVEAFKQDIEHVRKSPNKIVVLMNPFPWRYFLPMNDLRELEGIRCITPGCYYGSPHMSDVAHSLGVNDMGDLLRPGQNVLLGTTVDWRAKVLQTFARRNLGIEASIERTYHSKTGYFSFYEMQNVKIEGTGRVTDGDVSQGSSP